MELTKEQKLLQDVINKAWEDNAFKQELIANPVAAIEKLTGAKLTLPEGKTLIVRDQTDESTVYINIPAEKKMEDVELNEEQLELVSGGTTDPFTGDNPLKDIILIFNPTGDFDPSPTIQL